MMLETTCDRVYGESFMYYCTSEPKYLNRLRKLIEKHPDDVQIMFDDGHTLDVKIPASWFRAPMPPQKREMTDEQKQALAERLRKGREQNSLP